MHEQYEDDPDSVSESWREFFANGNGAAPAAPRVPPSDLGKISGDIRDTSSPAAERPAATPSPAEPVAEPPPATPAEPPPSRARRSPPAPTDHVRRRRRAGHRPEGRRGGDRRQHGAQPDGSDGDQLPQRPGQAARGQPQRHQRLPHTLRTGQGELHAHRRLRHRSGGHRRRAGDAQQLHHRCRWQGSPRRQRHRQHGSGGRCRQGRRHPLARRSGRQERQRDGLRRVLGRLRGDHSQGQVEQAHARRFPGRQRHPHEPRHDRDGAERAPADARAGGHRRRRQHRLPGRVRGRRPQESLVAGHLQGRHGDEHVRPSDHPGRREWAVPQAGPRTAARRARLLRPDLRVPGHALRGRQVASRRQSDRPRRVDAPEADAGRHADSGLPGSRPPDRRPRPAALEGSRDAGRARPVHLRVDDLGPRPRVPHRRHRRHRSHAARQVARRAA